MKTECVKRDVRMIHNSSNLSSEFPKFVVSHSDGNPGRFVLGNTIIDELSIYLNLVTISTNEQALKKYYCNGDMM
jgi:hypothetical protein